MAGRWKKDEVRSVKAVDNKGEQTEKEQCNKNVNDNVESRAEKREFTFSNIHCDFVKEKIYLQE